MSEITPRRSHLVVTSFVLALLVLAGLGSAQRATAQDPGWSPVIVPTGAYRDQIKSMPIEQRPYRPLHFYGNSVRRNYYRGAPSGQLSQQPGGQLSQQPVTRVQSYRPVVPMQSIQTRGYSSNPYRSNPYSAYSYPIQSSPYQWSPYQYAPVQSWRGSAW